MNDEMMKSGLLIERTVIICCLLILIKDSNASCNQPNDAELRVINQEIGFLRNENKNQNMEIAQLKDEMKDSKYSTVFNRKMIKELIDQRIKEYLTGDAEDEPQGTVGRRGKRPARLLPLQLLFDQDDDATTKKPPLRRFYGPPSNCSELAQLGYTLNGFYLVKPKSSDTTNKDDKTKKLETVFCSFKQEGPVNASRVEKRVGLLQMESIQRDGVYFYAIWNKTYKVDLFDEYILKFNYYLLNKGEAFRTAVSDYKNDPDNDAPGSAASMIFNAPESGEYQFVFTAIMKTQRNTSTTVGNRSMSVHLHHNFRRVAQSVSPNSGKVLMQTTLNVSEGDIFQVIVKPNPDEIKWASFSGHLLEKHSD